MTIEELKAKLEADPASVPAGDLAAMLIRVIGVVEEEAELEEPDDDYRFGCGVAWMCQQIIEAIEDE